MTNDYTEHVKQALAGNEDSLRRLAEVIQAPLRSYVYRITLNNDCTDDIAQETIVEMFKIFGQLNNADRFWPWLCKIALNKVRSHSRTQSRHKQLLREHAEELTDKSANLEGLANVINGEIKEAIFQAMSRLTDEQKAVMSMRCYESMPYSQIADIMGFTELKSRLLFLRGKKKLQKTLFRFGFNKKALLPALLIFGKLTAPSEAAALQVSITPATLGVGGLAATIGIATTKTALTIAAGTAIAAGTIVATNRPFNDSPSILESHQHSVVVGNMNNPHNAAEILEGYYYYPHGSNGPVMTRLTISESDNQKSCKVLQNHIGNFFVSDRSGRVKQNNYHYWHKDLSVMILPTDEPEFLSFLSGVEGRIRQGQTLNEKTNKRLLVVASRQDQADNISLAIQNYDALMEERFQYNWPADTHIEDGRDEIHRQGWCSVRMTGSIHGQTIDGIGQIPFIYSMTQSKPAWVEIKIGQNVIIDTPSGAVVIHAAGKSESYPSGTFMNALNQPWTGLHCIDTVRREAVRKKVDFMTACQSDFSRAIVRLQHDRGSLDYQVNMNQDLIENISFIDVDGNKFGEINFEYLAYDQFNNPAIKMPYIQKRPMPQTLTSHWLVQLANDKMIGNE